MKYLIRSDLIYEDLFERAIAPRGMNESGSGALGEVVELKATSMFSQLTVFFDLGKYSSIL